MLDAPCAQRAARQFQRHFDTVRNEERLESLEGKLAALQLISSEWTAWRARQKQMPKKKRVSSASGQQGGTDGDKLATKKKKQKKMLKTVASTSAA